MRQHITRTVFAILTLVTASAHAGIAFDATAGVVTIDGTSSNDTSFATYLFHPGGLLPYAVRVVLNGTTVDYPAFDVKSFGFYGHAGDDIFVNFTGAPSTAAGGSGHDVLTGGAGSDQLSGSGGDDVLNGTGGDDVLMGGSGNDQLHGGDGQDRLYGGPGDDALMGDAGGDVLVAVGGGHDTLTSGSSSDNVWLDTTDVLTDPSSIEQNNNYIHAIATFMPVSYNGGIFTTPIDKEPAGEDLPDPIADLGDNPGPWIDVAGQPLFASAGPTKDDIFQGDVGDCYFLATLSGMAQAEPNAIRRMVVELGDGSYAVRFWRRGDPVFVRVDGDLPTKGSTGLLLYADYGQEGSTWVAIVEKAYAFFRKEMGSYNSLAYGNGTHPEHLNLVRILDEWPDDGIGAQDVIDWHAAGEPDGPLKTLIHARVTDRLNWIHAQQAAGGGITAGAKSSFNNGSPIELEWWRPGGHIFMIDHVTFDRVGPTGLVLRNPYGPYVPITDFTRIYFGMNKAAASYPQ